MFFHGEFKPSRKNKALEAGKGCRKTFGMPKRNKKALGRKDEEVNNIPTELLLLTVKGIVGDI